MTNAITSQRLDNIRDAMSRAGVDALLVSQPENRRYLSGFTGSTAYLLIAPRTAYIATDSRYWEQAAMECPDLNWCRYAGEPARRSKEMVDISDVQRVGFEAQHATFSEVEDWRARGPRGAVGSDERSDRVVAGGEGWR